MSRSNSAPASINAFRFSGTTERQLRRKMLGTSAGTVVPLLQTLVSDYRCPRFRAARAVWAGHAQPDRLREREIRRLRAALRRVAQGIDDASAATRERLQQRYSYGEVLSGENTWLHLTTIRQYAHDIGRRLEASQAPTQPRGRPRRTYSAWLAQDLAIVLHLSDIHVTVSCEGKFGKILAMLLSEVEPESKSDPQNLFRLIKPAAQAVKQRSPQQVRELLTPLVNHMPNPAFWRQLLVLH